MVYLTSDLHGAYQAYLKCKELVDFSNNDELYILGDILDGNTARPGNCFKILEDVMQHDNIHLILGDREYYHVAYHYSQDEFFQNQLRDGRMEENALLQYISSHLSKQQKDRYFQYLGDQEVSALVEQNGIYFYLVHGAPCVYEGNDGDWEFDQVSSLVDFDSDYMEAIRTDPIITCPSDMTEKNTYVVCGHVPSRYVYDSIPTLKLATYGEETRGALKQRIIRKSHRILLDCGCSGDVLGRTQENWKANCAFVGIDKDRLLVQYVL